MQIESTVSLLPPDPPFWTKTAWIQLGYGVWVNMTAVGLGLTFAFPTVAIPQLLAADSPIKIDLDDESWIASALTLSSPIGSLLCGVLMDKYGRKMVLVLCEIPMCIGWFYAGFAPSAKHIIISRVIAGIGYGMALLAPRAYVTEITLPNMRGVIGALPNFFIAFGLSCMAGLSTFLSWKVVCFICGGYTGILAVTKFFLPDSPYYILMNSTKSYAKVNLRRFRSEKFNISAELETLNDYRKENNIRSLNFLETMQLVFTPGSCKPYAIISVYLLLMQLSGVHVVIVWAIEMLESSNSSMDATMGNFILALSRIGFAPVTLYCLYKTGRRVIALISAIGLGIVAMGHCIFLFSYTQPSIVPMFSYIAYFGFATIGYYSIPFLMMFELLPLQVRGIMSAICFSQFNLFVFSMNWIYPHMRRYLGLAMTMGFFGLCSFICALVIYFILPETKDLTLQEIEEYFNSRRPTLVSQRSVMSNQLIRQGDKMYKSNIDIMIKQKAQPGTSRPRRTQSNEIDMSLKQKLNKQKEKPYATKDASSLMIKEVDEENDKDATIKDSSVTREVKIEDTNLQDLNRERRVSIDKTNIIPKDDSKSDPTRSRRNDTSHIRDQSKEPQSKDQNQNKDTKDSIQAKESHQSTSKDPNQNKGTQNTDPVQAKESHQSTSKDPDQNKGTQSKDPVQAKESHQSTSKGPNQNKGIQIKDPVETKESHQSTSKDPDQNKETQSKDPVQAKESHQSTIKDPNQNKGTQSNDLVPAKESYQSTNKDSDQKKATQIKEPIQAKESHQSTSKDPDQNKETQTKDSNQSTSKDPNKNKDNQKKDDEPGQSK